MAHQSFLTPEQLQQAQELLSPPFMTPDGDVRQLFCFTSENFSYWLGSKVEELFKKSPDWKDCHPIMLGSWSRGELCPRSDVDVLFCGEEKKVQALVDDFQERGLKIRYRMPHNFDDWTENVEAFDILALLKGKPLTPEGAVQLFTQQKKIWARKKHYRSVLLKAIQQERAARVQRYDSITNYLEPNIKFGPGGLRDLEQGLQIYELFTEKFTNPGHALNVLQYYRNYLLTIRQKLHLEGLNDILIGTAQFDIGQWLGFKSHKDFMRSLQRGLSRVNFYSDWIIEVAQTSEGEIKKLESIQLSRPEHLPAALHKNSSVLVQKKVREHLDELFPDRNKKKTALVRRKALEKMLSVKAPDAYLISVFRSRLIDKLVPEIRRLVGYVQHDQYHRFTADSHIMQACREVKRIFVKPKELGPLSYVAGKLKQYDWKVLAWSSLYHDLAKGLDSHDHSEAGIQIVDRDFKQFGFDKKFTDDVHWMVKNHLELSQAAFRKNALDPKVWQDLRVKGVEGQKLYRLALFTAIDIRATNPEAWTDWKAELLKSLVNNLESKKAQDYFDFQSMKLRRRLKVSDEVYEALGPVLLESLTIKDLVEDLKLAEGSDKSLSPKILKTRRGDIWVRFHEREDRRGLLADYVSQLYSLGLGIRRAAIHTLPKIGVYDWFQITTQKPLQQLSHILKSSELKPKNLPKVHFASIQLVSADESEWIISFKGPDQPGLLASASQALNDLGLCVTSARVHTWGRQVDDIFIVRAEDGDPQTLVRNLCHRYQIPFE